MLLAAIRVAGYAAILRAQTEARILNTDAAARGVAFGRSRDGSIPCTSTLMLRVRNALTWLF